MQISDRIKLLILGSLQDTNTDEDALELKRWATRNKENIDYFNKIKLGWILTSKISGGKQFSAEKQWERLQSKMSRLENRTSFLVFSSSKVWNILKIAAIWLFIFFSGSVMTFLLMQKDKNMSNQITTIYSPLGSKSQITLPDGSSVWLNAGSILEYKNDYNTGSREVKLSGEGFFEVISNRSKPFVVNTYDISIVAFGTTFNVKAYPEEEMVVTTLVKGEITIKGKDNEEKPFSVDLEPNQKITYFADNKSHIINQPESNRPQIVEKQVKTFIPVIPSVSAYKDIDIKTDLYTSWKDKRWIIEGEKLRNLAVMLERRYNVSIEINSNRLETFSFSGTIENETLEQVFEILSLTLPIKYTIDVGKVMVNLDDHVMEIYKSAY